MRSHLARASDPCTVSIEKRPRPGPRGTYRVAWSFVGCVGLFSFTRGERFSEVGSILLSRAVLHILSSVNETFTRRQCGCAGVNVLFFKTGRKSKRAITRMRARPSRAEV